MTAFLDVVTTAEGDDFLLEELEVKESCLHAGERFATPGCATRGAIIVAIRKRDGTFDTTPSPDELIEVGDVLIGVGTPEEIQKLEDFLRHARPLAH